ncbi:MAG: hypothetical protein CSB34_01145 [Desulfobulbus propionicus]|nr:MAG: hypothetical protein CSB34_01145 [Desulfobulbus propionicus]
MLLLLLGCGGAGLWIWEYVTTPASGEGSALVTIPKGSGVRAVGRLLAEKKLLRNDIRFLLVARYTKTATRLKAGEYEIPYKLTPSEVLKVLEQGKVYYHSITIPEGFDLVQIAAAFAQQGWVDQETFFQLATDPLFTHSLGISADSLEGYLFPDTYFLARGSVTTKSVMQLMVQRFQAVVKKLPVDQQKDLSLHQIVTLASIIEKETGAAYERPFIAGVFLNRLQKKMRLQSDPTVIYGIEGFNGNITKNDLRRPTPYNTYVISGLPPGPICSPGKEALEAVLFPAETRALYFVSRNDGTHTFSNSLKEHNRAVRKYQKRVKRENKK